MTDGDALYRAIVARPEDDTPRLVYADWLEENGHEEEAEFIRLDCRLEASTPDMQEYVELMERRDELRLWLEAHASAPHLRLAAGLTVASRGEWWNQTLRGFPPRFLSWEYVGGRGRPGVKGMRRLAAALEKAFLKIPTRWLTIRDINVAELAELLRQPAMAAIEYLTLMQFGLDEPAGDEAARIIAACQQLRNLRGAALVFPVGAAGANALARSEHLGRMEWLALDSNNLTPEAIRSLGTGGWFHNLRALNLESWLTADAFEEISRLPPFPSLHTLNFSGNSFPASAWQTFARSKTFPQLTRLELGGLLGVRVDGADMSDGRMAALAGANGFCLRVLALGACSIGDEGIEALVSAPWAGSLRWLNVESNLLGPKAAKATAGCQAFKDLQYLDIGDNPIGSTGLKAIAGSPNLRNLTTLLLGNCTIRNRDGSRKIAHEFLKKLDLPKLRHLSLSGLPIGANSVPLLGEEKFVNLTRLELDNCKLTDEAIPDLIQSPILQGLIELNLQGNRLKTGINPLADKKILPRLSRCSLNENPIPADVVNKLARRRPGVIVSRE